MRILLTLRLFATMLFGSCAPASDGGPGDSTPKTGVLIANLELPDVPALEGLQAAFESANPGYGFDELYIVQAAAVGAKLLMSERVGLIEDPDSVTREEAAELLTERALRAGDLMYLPRGTMHRGLGGMMVQVISVPGFLPRAEIGLDHHLRRINESLGLEGDAALPFHVTTSDAATVM